MWEQAVQQERMCAGWLPSLFCLAEKLQAAQTPVVIVASRLELTWHGKCPWLVHLSISSPQYSWIKATGDGKTDFPCGALPSSSLWCFRQSAPMKTWQRGVPTWVSERKTVPEVQAQKWGLREMVHLHQWWWGEGCIMGVLDGLGQDMKGSLCSYPLHHKADITCCWTPEFSSFTLVQTSRCSARWQHRKPQLLWGFSICSLQWHHKFTQT